MFAVATGSLSDSVTDAVAENPTMGEVFARNGLDPTDGFYSTMALFFALMIAAFAVTFGPAVALGGTDRAHRGRAGDGGEPPPVDLAWTGFTVLARCSCCW